MLSLCPFDISVGVGAFVIGLSQISSFFSNSNALYGQLHLSIINYENLSYIQINEHFDEKRCGHYSVADTIYCHFWLYIS